MHDRGRAEFGTGESGDAWRARLANPVAIREARTRDEVEGVVAWIDAQSRSGHWGVLLLTYEAAPAMDPALTVRDAGAGPVPLAWAASYASVGAAESDDRRGLERPLAADPVAWRPAIDEAWFARDIARILSHISAGDTYQVNYTFPLIASFPHDPWAWFDARARHAHVPFPACIDIGAAVVMSLSPELFVARRGDHLQARPMKGTIRRGRWLEEDQRLSQALVASEKARAENVMIVDLLRNDIGRVAETGSVRVSGLCALERYPTVWQLTSRIDATLRPNTSLWDLLRAVFPCGSVTGAPKVRTTEIIADCESSPRGLYTGAVCLLQPGGDVTASVPIRTAILDRVTGVATFSVGAGITADSTAADEWAECLAKARVVRPAAVPDDAFLLETMPLVDGAFARRAAHLARMQASARLFGWPADPGRLDAALDGLLADHSCGSWRVRLLLDRHGRVLVEAVPFVPDARRWRVCLAAHPVDTRSPLLFNKSTSRSAYDEARAAAPGADDVLLWNARGELTESCLANLVVAIDGRRVTPPIACGLLPGVFRGQLLATGEVEERVVSIDDLTRASGVWLVNSLRGWIDVEFLRDRDGRPRSAGAT
jgi:para-aminobenzoate synthetase/4-amino-4-deoxychorismate lyase